MLEVARTKLSGSLSYNNAVWGAALLVASITFIVYLPALNNDFVNWDDFTYVSKNHEIRSIDLGFLKWGFTAVVSSNWHPLTMFSHALDYALWGLDPWGHHLTSIIFHSVNTLLVFILVVWLLGYARAGETGISNDFAGPGKKALIAGIVTALLFGIHPVHVESVAWVSERKDVLSAFFFLLSVLAYLRFTSSRDSKRSIFYGACLILFAMALMSKPMAVTLPVVLLILDCYPLGRLTLGGGLKGARWLLIEKAPFFVLSLLSSLITLWAQRTGGALTTLEVTPLIVRILVALRAYAFYIYKMVLPIDLAPFYPYPRTVDFFTVEYIGSFILLIVVTSFCLWSVKRGKLFSAVWLYYLVTLIPVIGIIQVGEQAAADRYTYLPSLGPFLLAGLGAGAAFERYSKKQYQIAIIAALVILSGILANKTLKQIAIWQDSITLWSYEINLFPDNTTAYINRGNAYNILGNYREAIKDLSRANELDPNSADAHNNLGFAYSNEGRIEKAIEELKKALRLRPDLAEAHYNLGNAYSRKGMTDKALEEYKKAIRHKPDFAEAHNNLGNAHYIQKRIDEAIAEYKEAIRLNPYNTKAHYNLGIAFYNQGRINKAMAEYKEALRLKPDHAKAHNNLGLVYDRQGRTDEAIKEYRTALRLNPEIAEVHNNLGNIYHSQGRIDGAIEEFQIALRLEPDYAVARYNLGLAYNSKGLKDEAIREFEEVLKIRPDFEQARKMLQSVSR
jgi:tetratricopeptide (TPR) repeat protein